MVSLFIVEDFTRENILGEITFDQVETLSTYSSATSIPKLILTHGPDGSIDHDSAVNTVRSPTQSFHQTCFESSRLEISFINYIPMVKNF